MTSNFNLNYLFDMVHFEFEVQVLAAFAIDSVFLALYFVGFGPAKLVTFVQFPDLDLNIQLLTSVKKVIVLVIVPVFVVADLCLNVHLNHDFVLFNFSFPAQLEGVESESAALLLLVAVCVLGRRRETGSGLPHFD